jgi:hypothetical protein
VTFDWRKHIADAGGPDSAMLHGAGLARLMKHIEELEADKERLVAGAHEAIAKAMRESDRAARSERLLVTERDEVVRLSNLVEPITRQLAAVEEVVAAAYNEASKGVVTARLTAALAALDAIKKEPTR